MLRPAFGLIPPAQGIRVTLWDLMHASSGCRGPDATIDRLLGWRGYGGCNHRFALNCSWQCPGFKDISFYWLHPFLSISILRFKEICFFVFVFKSLAAGSPRRAHNSANTFPMKQPHDTLQLNQKPCSLMGCEDVGGRGKEEKKTSHSGVCSHTHTCTAYGSTSGLIFFFPRSYRIWEQN